MDDVGIFYGHWIYHFMAIGYIVCPLGICCSNLVYFPRLGILYQEKSGIPAPRHTAAHQTGAKINLTENKRNLSVCCN
jgi:hypothetical protein